MVELVFGEDFDLWGGEVVDGYLGFYFSAFADGEESFAVGDCDEVDSLTVFGALDKGLLLFVGVVDDYVVSGYVEEPTLVQHEQTVGDLAVSSEDELRSDGYCLQI